MALESRAVEITRSRAAKSVMWSVVENGGLALISLSSLIVYSRFLSVSDFGSIPIVLAIVELISSMSDPAQQPRCEHETPARLPFAGNLCRGAFA